MKLPNDISQNVRLLLSDAQLYWREYTFTAFVGINL